MHGVVVLNPKFRIVDEDGNEVAINSSGMSAIMVRDEEQLETLIEIKNELKRMNFYLSMLTDIQVTTNDVEDMK